MNIRKIIVLILLISFVFIPFSLDAAAKEKKKKSVRTVEIQTKDELILTGTLTIPETASTKQKVPLVILLHSLGSNRLTYTTLAEKLKAKNIASLSIDSRGHHNSTTKLNGKRTFWQNYSKKTFAKYPTDIIEIMDYVKGEFVAIDTNRISILGADINANAAAIAAAKPGTKIKSLVLISPTMNFKGLAPSQSLMNYGNHPVMIIVSKNDTLHYKDAIILEKYVTGKVNFVSTQTGGTGDNIIRKNPYLNSSIADWISKNI